MNNKKIQEKILKEISLKFPNNKHRGLGEHGLYLYQEMDLREAITLTIAEEKKRHYEFVEKLKNELIRESEIDYDMDINNIKAWIDKINKEFYGDEK